MSDSRRSRRCPSRRREVVRQAWSVGIASGTYGVSFGALAVAAGLDIWQAQVLSLLMFTGGSQFAFVGIIGAGGLAAAPAAIATSSMLGIRNGLYGLQTSRFLGVTGLRRLAAAQLTIDESTAVGIAQPEPPAQRLGLLADRDSRSSSCGTSRPSRVRSSATRSATRVRWAWMPQRPPPSSPSCGPGCAAGTPLPRPCSPHSSRCSPRRSRPGCPSSSPAPPPSSSACGTRGGTRPRSRVATAPCPDRTPRHDAVDRGRRRVHRVAPHQARRVPRPRAPHAGERTSRVTTLLPVALLAALVVVQTVVGPGGSLVIDARLVAVGVAVVLLLLRANFLVVVLAAAAVAAALRAVGWG